MPGRSLTGQPLSLRVGHSDLTAPSLPLTAEEAAFLDQAEHLTLIAFPDIRYPCWVNLNPDSKLAEAEGWVNSCFPLRSCSPASSWRPRSSTRPGPLRSRLRANRRLARPSRFPGSRPAGCLNLGRGI